MAGFGLLDRSIAVKRMTIMLILILTAAVGLFCGYLYWIHNNLDTTGPVITVSEELLEISVEDPEEALFQGIRAVDQVDGDVSQSLIVERIYGISEDCCTTVSYAAFDRAGNVSKIDRTVRFSDYHSPKFELYDSLCYAAGTGVDIMDCIGAEDVLEGDIRRRVHATLISDTGSIDKQGSHVVRFQVTNSLGDTVTADLPVEVYDPEWYSASVELEEYLVYIKKGANFNPKEYLKTFEVRGEPMDVRYYIPSDVSCHITNRVNTNVPGIYTVSYVLSQNLDLNTFSGISMLIVIVEE